MAVRATAGLSNDRIHMSGQLLCPVGRAQVLNSLQLADAKKGNCAFRISDCSNNQQLAPHLPADWRSDFVPQKRKFSIGAFSQPAIVSQHCTVPL